MIKFYTLLVALFTTPNFYAQTITLLKDINPGEEWCSFISPKIIGNKLYFGAEDGTHGYEPWVTDGTEEGTYMIKDINPGSEGSYADRFEAYNGKVYFAASDNIHGRELWETDGTEAGTQLVMDINPGAESSNPLGLSVGLGLLFFQANNGQHGDELWTYNSYTNTTAMVLDFCPGPNGSLPYGFIEYDGRMYFSAYTETFGRELSYSDGTAEGTAMLKDIATGGLSNGNMFSKVIYNGRLYFTGDHPDTGEELWSTDGTEEGTQLVVDLVQGPAYSLSDDSGMAAYNGSLYFAGRMNETYNWQLWKSNGTAEGTATVSAFEAPLTSSPPFLRDAFEFNNRLYFGKGMAIGAGIVLWSTDGTQEGTVQAVDPSAGGFNYVDFCSIAGDSIYYLDYIPGTDHWAVWKSDGTAEGTVLIPFPEGSLNVAIEFDNGWMGIVGSKVIYYARHMAEIGRELYTFDIARGVSVAETKINKDIHLYPNPATDAVRITLPQRGTVAIYNATGMLLESITINTNHTLDVSNYAQGIYLIKLNDEVVRFIKE